MAITDKKTGPWGLDQVYNKINQGSIWDYSGAQEMWAAGKGTDGALAQNNQINYSSPVQIPGSWDTDLISYAFAAGSAFLNTKTDGTLWIWGKNNDGELGLNQVDGTRYSSPVQLPGTDWALSSRGDRSNAAIKTDGTLWMWGGNSRGELGQNDVNKRSSPVQVGSDTTWSKAYLSINSIFATKTDGTLWAWGQNNNGTLGQNLPGNSHRSSPVQVPGTWISVITSNYRSGGVREDGTMWTWGANSNGELGHNSRGPSEYRSSPTQVPGTTWSKITMGSEKSAALRTDGTLWTWGNNYMGTLGQNTANSSPTPDQKSSPVQVPGTTWRTMSMSYGNFVATKTDNTLWVWGSGYWGLLGQNNRTNYSSPVQIPGTSWIDGVISSAGDGAFFTKMK